MSIYNYVLKVTNIKKFRKINLRISQSYLFIKNYFHNNNKNPYQIAIGLGIQWPILVVFSKDMGLLWFSHLLISHFSSNGNWCGEE